MNINITGNPGTGNTYMEIRIQHVDHFYTTSPAPINNNGTRVGQQDTPQASIHQQNIPSLRDEILAYVDRLRPHLADEWKSTYLRTWEDILDLDIVASLVYSPGKQQGTNFNRNLVANIIHYLSGREAYGKGYNAARFAGYLEGDKDHSIRSALGKNPSPDVVSRLNRYFEQ